MGKEGKESDRILKGIKELETLFEKLRKEPTEKNIKLAEQKLKQLSNFITTDGEKDFSAKSAKKELADIKETLQRVQAEFENSRKRLEKEKEDFSRTANAGLVKDLLPVLDSMDAAEKEIPGLEPVKGQLVAVLRANGLEQIKAVGEKFDPMLHDCMMQEKNEKKEDGIVLEELHKGYLLNGKVLRHSKVKISKR